MNLPMGDYGQAKAEAHERKQEAILQLSHAVGSIATLSAPAFASLCRRLPDELENMRVSELLSEIEDWQTWYRNIHAARETSPQSAIQNPQSQIQKLS